MNESGESQSPVLLLYFYFVLPVHSNALSYLPRLNNCNSILIVSLIYVIRTTTLRGRYNHVSFSDKDSRKIKKMSNFPKVIYLINSRVKIRLQVQPTPMLTFLNIIFNTLCGTGKVINNC